MDKTLYLCFACAALMADSYSLTELPEQLKNGKCARCGRKVWGANYKIEKNNCGTTFGRVCRSQKANP